MAYFLGDAIAQKFTRSFDRGRLARATIAGTVSHGPQLHYWTLILEHFLPGAGLKVLLGKIALDQIFFSLYINAGARHAAADRPSSPRARVRRRPGLRHLVRHLRGGRDLQP